MFDKNLELVHELETMANKKGCKSGQIGLAWIREQSKKPGMPVVIPIPGSSQPDRVTENMTEVALSQEDMKEIARILASAPQTGERYVEPLPVTAVRGRGSRSFC